ncbi:MAG: peptidoglycan/xylan/chitin deacetylase (PgdA/CDA1 family) [Bacteriovoracaceae bacterium]|jgi:peptidoglycan/xylan/chitin deacetylase (PgdA/CDA1 family)
MWFFGKELNIWYPCLTGEFMKFIIIITALFSSSVMAHSHSNKEISESVMYANIYADKLIEEFDESLDKGAVSFFNMYNRTEFLSGNLIYAKILAARDYIENNGSVTKFRKNLIVEVRNASLFNQVVSEINEQAIEVLSFQKNLKSLESNNENVIYPSSSQSGNLTGNTFPNKVWSLTFDDGPRSGRTEVVVDNLYSRNMKGTFFMLTREAKRYRKSVDYVLNADMEIALHSYNHKNLNKVSESVMDYEIGTALNELSKIGNQSVRLFRLPYGSGLRNQTLRTKIAKNNLVHIFWNVDTLDWKDKDPQSILKRTQKQMKLTPNKSGIILFHDIHAQTVIASELVMDHLQENGDVVCTVGAVIDYINQDKQDCLK